jgi:hypothetical protein
MRFPLRVYLFACFAVMTIPLLAQSPNGNINGLISDPTNAAVADADIVAMNDVTGVQYTTKTNSEGMYALPNLPPGPYRIQVSKVGFKTLIKPDITLNVQDSLSINFTLLVGAFHEIVTVQGGAPLVNTENASVSTVVDRQFVENMPLNGRSFQALIALTPGVVLTPATAGEQGQFSINGQRADANYLTVDGVSANISAGGGSGLRQAATGTIPGTSALGGTNNLVSVDAMQEFRVQTSSFAPEFGRTPGGQISIATRSGTNLFHGTAFDYLRNDVMDANDWFGNHNDLPRPRERQNDFGGVFGGPIIKNQTFFFFSYEGLRLRQPQTQTSVVPTLNSRGEATVGMQPFLNAYPLPNGNDLGNDLAAFNASFSTPSSLDAHSIRVDHVIRSNATIFGRYSYSPSDALVRGPVAELNNTLDTKVRTHTLTLGSTQNLAANVNNELRLNYSNLKTLSTFQIDNFGGAVPPSDSLLFPSGVPASTGLFALVINGAGGFDIGRNGVNEQRQANVVDNIAVAAAAHQLKFGLDYRWLAPITSPFSYLQSALFLDMNSAISGMPLAAIVEAERGVALLSQNVSVYAQDTWKATARLNLTYGLRWDINPALKGENPASTLLTVQGLDNPPTMSLAPPGKPLYATTYGNIAPRVGITYQLSKTPGKETVIRGGIGIFYDVGSGSLASAANEFPFVAQNVLFGTPFPLTAQQAVPPIISASPPVTGNLYVADPKLKLPRTYQWNLTVEQALGSSQSLSMAYVGAAGRDLLRQDTLALPNPDFETVFVTRNSATSDYHALQIKFQRRLVRGLQALASYALAHSIDIASNDSGSFNTPPELSTKLDRGNSNFDIRHAATLAVSYDLPSPGQQAVLRRVLGNWSVDTLLMARSATPVDISGPFFLVGSVEFNARPNVVLGVPFYLHGPQYPGDKALNGAAFTNPPDGTQGNLGRDVVRGFGAWQQDFAIRRQFQFGDRVNLQLRVEFFNLFNHPNFGNPVASLSDPLFGLSTGTLANSLASSQGGFNGGLNPLYQFGGPRSGQLALKIQF